MLAKYILVLISDRANYGRLKPVMNLLELDSRVKLGVLATGTVLLKKFGKCIEQIKKDGFSIHSEIYMEYMGSTDQTMALSIGSGITQISNEIKRLKPDIFLIIGDRYEALAASIAAVYNNTLVAHIQGGEVSGSIDESARHCITKLSHIHFPSTEKSKERILKMGENPNNVFCYGCPSRDVIENAITDLANKNLEINGVGNKFNFLKEYFIVSYHPDTTDLTDADLQNVKNILDVLNKFKKQCLWFWPNVDSGSDAISSCLRIFREKNNDSNNWLTLVKNVTPEEYIILLNNSLTLIGNSSSFVRDSSFLGVPVVLIGDRQKNREHSSNIRKLKNYFTKSELIQCLKIQLEIGKFPISTLYGEYPVSCKIIEKLISHEAEIKKEWFE